VAGPLFLKQVLILQVIMSYTKKRSGYHASSYEASDMQPTDMPISDEE